MKFTKAQIEIIKRLQGEKQYPCGMLSIAEKEILNACYPEIQYYSDNGWIGWNLGKQLSVFATYRISPSFTPELEPELLLVPESVGFVKWIDKIGLLFGKSQVLRMGEFGEYVVCDSISARHIKLSLHKTTFGEVKVGEWFIETLASLNNKSGYFLKTKNDLAHRVCNMDNIVGLGFGCGNEVYLLKEVQE